MSNATIKKISPFALPKLQKYLDKFKNIFRRSDTMNAAERYMTGLMSDIPYKNCGMMAEYMEGTSAQSLQDFLTNSPWDYGQLNRQRVEHMLENAVSSDGALVFDDTGFEKKGNCSVGVARQYSGTLGKVGNCQIAVSCQYTDIKYTWPVNARLYLPESWTSDSERMKRAKVPENITFKTKPQIALELLDQANGMGIKHSIILGDSFYGRDNTFIEGLEARGETYALSVPCDFTVRLEQDIMWKGFHRHFTMVMPAYSWLTLQRRVKNEPIKQYEVLVDRPCVTSPSFSIREVFSPEALFT